MGLIARAKDTPAKVQGVDGPAAQCARQLEPIVFTGHEGTIELRAFKVSRRGSRATHTEISRYPATEEGLKHFARDATALSVRAEGVYLILNPLPEGLDHNATDADVTRRCWLPIDIDPERMSENKNVSSTDEEKQSAWMVVTSIRRWLAEQGWPAPILADSGNGYHLLYRIDLDPSSDLVARVIHLLDDRFSTSGAKVDRKVVNPSRLWKAYGTMARKGHPDVPDTDERPYRLSHVLEQPSDLVVVSEEQLLSVLASAEVTRERVTRPGTNGKHTTNGHPAGTPRKRKGLIARAVDTDDPLDRARAYLETCDPAISGQRGHSTTYRVVCEIGPGFGLDPDDCLKLLLAHYNPRCQPPWSEKELRHKVDQAYEKDTKPFGHHVEEGKEKRGPGRPRKNAEPPPIEDPETGRLETFDDPHRLARLYLDQVHAHPEGRLLKYWDEQWHTWDGQSWKVRKDREIHAELTSLIKTEFDRVASETGQPARSVGTRLIANVAQALRGETLLTLAQMPAQPAWMDPQEDDHAPLEYLPVSNGLVHLPTLVDLGSEDPGVIRKLTPRYFSPSVLGYAFDGNADAPERWIEFLTELWPEDADAVLCVQEWFGYLLTLDTRYQKILLLVGPRRSGKGTLTRILIRLVGHANHRAPTLSSLANPFGLETLIGRQLAIVPEARLSGRVDSQAIVERLLSISGEDPQSIPRKYLTDWHGQLFTRFVLLGNELPRLGDQSGALASRLVILRLERSFLGQEDLGLLDKLEPELPGILLWAIEGLRRLREQGGFTIPESSREIIEEFEKLSSPVGAFLEECCDLGGESRVLTGDLYQAWTKWCEDNGRDHPGDAQSFGRSLRAALPRLQTTRPREGGTQVRYYLGIKLKSQPDDPDAPF